MNEWDRHPDADPAVLERALFARLGRHPQQIERASSGVSAAVYRVVADNRTYYARLGEEEDDDLTIDARVLAALRAAGVTAPEVIHVAPFDARVGRSLLITTAIAGASVASTPAADVNGIVREAGRDLALIHQLPIHGFGFVRRDRATWPPAGEFASYEAFVRAELPDPWPGPFAAIFRPRSLARLAAVVEHEQNRVLANATFAHGDFDLTHIFAVEGRYSGLIDFGEIRGAEPTFDFGVFTFANADTERETFLRSVIEGYRTVTPLKHAHDAITRSAILHGLRLLGRWTRPGFRRRRPVHDFARRVERLLEGL